MIVTAGIAISQSMILLIYVFASKFRPEFAKEKSRQCGAARADRGTASRGARLAQKAFCNLQYPLSE